MKYTAKFRTTPPPQPVLFSLYEEEPGGGRPEAFVGLRPQERVQRHTVEHSASSTRSRLILSRLSKCPRSCSMMSLCALLSVTRSWENSWWKCRRTQGTRSRWLPRSSVRGERFVVFSLRIVEGEVHVEVFKVLVLDRIQQRIWSRVLKFQFLRVGGGVADVFKVLSQYRIQQRLWSRSLTFQLVGVFLIFSQDKVLLLPHRVVCMTMQMKILQVFFALFPFEKSAKLGSHTASELLPVSSPSTRRAYEDRNAPG